MPSSSPPRTPAANVHRLARIGVGVAAALAGLAIVLAASGWLYLVGPGVHLRGPIVGDALPLDELSKHSAVPLALFAAVWGTAALALGMLARAVSLGRLSAALLAALFVGLWGYLTTGVSILVVRQIAAESAFRDAATQRAVLLPALLAGIAGALLARGDAMERQRTRVVLAWFTAAAGVVTVIDSFLPEHSRTLLSEFAPQSPHLSCQFNVWVARDWEGHPGRLRQRFRSEQSSRQEAVCQGIKLQAVGEVHGLRERLAHDASGYREFGRLEQRASGELLHHLSHPVDLRRVKDFVQAAGLLSFD